MQMKAWTENLVNVEMVLALYRSRDIPTAAQIAKKLKTQPQYVLRVLKTHMPLKERKALAALRYSRSKSGPKSPMYGRTGARHHNWKGDCEDGKGYLTRVWKDGARHFVHSIVMMEFLGVTSLPPLAVIHHIDGNKKNNDISNLALTTGAGHAAIHSMQEKDSLSVALKKSRIVDALKYLT